jgi:hypothetical protein
VVGDCLKPRWAGSRAGLPAVSKADPQPHVVQGRRNIVLDAVAPFL